MNAPSRWNWLKWLIILTFVTADGFAGDEVVKDIQNGIIRMYNLDPLNTEVEMRTREIQIPEGAYDSLDFKQLTRTEPRGLMAFEISAYQNGEKIAEDQVRVRIAYHEIVYVTTDRIGRREQINPEKLTLKRMEITSLTDKPLTSDDDLTGVWSLKSIKKDQILTTGLVESVPPILSGQGVSIQYINGPLEITARGTALEDGQPGEMIRVRNDESRKTILCTVIDSKTVQISN